MKKILFCLIITIGLTSFKPAGVTTASLICKSESERTIFTAELEDIDSRIKNGIFTIYLQSKSKSKQEFSKYKLLKFWAIPKTFITLLENNSEGK